MGDVSKRPFASLAAGSDDLAGAAAFRRPAQSALVATLGIAVLLAALFLLLRPAPAQATHAGGVIHDGIGSGLFQGAHGAWDPGVPPAGSPDPGWVSGFPKGYSEGETVAFRLDGFRGLESESFQFNICLDERDNRTPGDSSEATVAFVGLTPWDTSFPTWSAPTIGEPEFPPEFSTYLLTGIASDPVRAINANITGVTYRGLVPTGDDPGVVEFTTTVATGCLVGRNVWTVEFQLLDDGDGTPDEEVTATIVWGGLISKPGDNSVSGFVVTAGKSASNIQGNFQAQLGKQSDAPDTPNVGQQTINFAGGDIAPPPTGSIGGYKFEDLNGDGAWDTGEPGLEGWSIYLDLNRNDVLDVGEPTTTTGSNGFYEFTQLLPDTYVVRELLQASWRQTFPQPVVPGRHTITLTSGQVVDGVNFGNTVPGSIHGYKFEDLNANGDDDGEPRLAGVTITVTGDVDGDGAVDTLTATTDANGEYWFENLWPGDYRVTEIAPAGFMQTTQNPPIIEIQSRQEYVTEPGQAMLQPGDPRVEIVVGPDLVFGNARLGEVTVEKTAVPERTKVIRWRLAKRLRAGDGLVNEQTVKMFLGDEFMPNYRIDVNKVVNHRYDVHGAITVSNTTRAPVRVNKIEDAILAFAPGNVRIPVTGITCDLMAISPNGGTNNLTPMVGVTPPFDLASGYKAVCEYWAERLERGADLSGVNVVEVTVNGQKLPVARAPFTFSSTHDVLDGFESVFLTDTNMPDLRKEFRATGFFEYRGGLLGRPFRCDERGMQPPHVNTARLIPAIETIQPPDPLAVDTATVIVKCFALAVDKRAHASFDRTWIWSLEKYSGHEQILLARKKDPKSKKNHAALSRFAKVAIVDYAVKAEATPRDHNLKVRGYIDVSNPEASMRAAHVRVLDTLLDANMEPTTAAAVSNCRLLPGGGSPEVVAGLRVIPSGKTLRCDYVVMPAAKDRFNKATAVLKNFRYSAIARKQPLDRVARFMKKIPVNWNVDPTVVRNATVDVDDSQVGRLGSAMAPGPKWFGYRLLIAPGERGVPLCGKGSVKNRAIAVVGDKIVAEDSVDIPATVLCFVSAGSDPKKDGDTGGVVVDPKITPEDPRVIVNGKGEITGVKSEEVPGKIVCVPSKHYDGKRGAKGDPTWRKIGPKGMNTRFFRAAKKFTYAKALRMRGKSPYARLASAYAEAQLHVLSSVPVNARTSKAMIWTARYLAKNTPKAKKQRKLMVRNAKVLKRFNKGARRYDHPGCATASA